MMWRVILMLEQVRRYLEVLDQGMQDNQILLLKLHPLVQKGLDLDSYHHIRLFHQTLIPMMY